MKILLPILLFCAALLAAPASPTSAPLDRIVAVIDDKIILESELNEMVFYAFQSAGKAVPVGSPEFESLKINLLQNMIDDRLLLKEAEAESVTVSKDDVARQRDAQLEGYEKKLGSHEAFEQEIKKSLGISLSKFRKNLEDQIQEQMIKYRLSEKIRMKQSITRAEVEKFYADYKDSLPKEKQSIHLAHIQLKIEPSQAIVDKAFKRMQGIEEKLATMPFEKAAEQFSDDPSAKNGGDLGFFQKGQLDVTFEKTAFSLSPGEVSKIIRSAFGFHIIKLEERHENEIRCRHILVLVMPSAEDTAAAIRKLDSLRTLALSDTAFAARASQLSDDKLTKSKGGDLGWVSIASLSPEFAKAVDSVAPGQNALPVLIGDSYHLFRVLEKKDDRPLTLDNDYDAIKEMATNFKLKEELKLLADKQRRKVYIENRLESTATPKK